MVSEGRVVRTARVEAVAAPAQAPAATAVQAAANPARAAVAVPAQAAQATAVQAAANPVRAT
jgi:hypothetical protein